MRFVEISKAKGIKVGEEVYTVDSDGKHGIAKLVSRTENGNGTQHEFEVPQYTNSVKVSNVTHVAVMRDKKDATGTPE